MYLPEDYHRLRSEWTGKTVQIKSSRSELSRFANKTGTVITVNKNGKCLVDFHDGGWYDIEPNDLINCTITEQISHRENTTQSAIPVRQK